MKYYKTLSLGCKVNTYEIQAIKELLNEKGYIESHDDKCDVFIINTCAVTQVGEQKSRQMIRKSISKYPNAITIVMGCYSQLHPEIVESIEGVDIVLGTSNRSKIVEFLEDFIKNNSQIVCVNKENRNEEYECLKITSYSENTRAFIKIQDGCNNFCSYCIIPYTRGNFRSRPKEEIFSEIKNLCDRGFLEIVLTGIDSAGYGKEFKEEKYRFNDLLKEIIQREPRLKRIRISSMEESELDDEFIEILKNNPVVAPHLHIPLQSGSEGVLKRMRRKYNKEQFLSTINKIKEAVPNIALACDVIVGFPGETEEEFVECMDFIKECGFHYLHVFPYSIRPGTPASKMENQIDPKIKNERVHRLISFGENLKEEYENKFIGKELNVIVETYNPKEKMYHGYSDNYIDVKIRSEENILGKYIKVKYEK
ncbi:MAG: tRNA (N(6)-L-threonylcarbamoyladenosine(37)-C(2))-methylthiotransferase MtaB [Erysipelotrichaceae bacterium]|nr:tRNA (N(6)-L-threonylcarbamoyladenosine(37)-C(2))-methylthiotransferase MtaB [Erysipelotrichaceae bacterium]